MDLLTKWRISVLQCFFLLLQCDALQLFTVCNPQSKPRWLQCNLKSVDITKEEICYEKYLFYRWTAEISCLNGYVLNGPDSYTCTSEGTWNPTSIFSCEAKTTPTTSPGHATKPTAHTTEGSATSDTSSKAPEKSTKTTPTTSPGHATKPTAHTTEGSATSDTSSKAPEKSNDGDTGAVVAAAVTVPVITIITTAVVIALFLWRRRRPESNSATEIHPRTSITNKSYEGGPSLDRRISLLNMRTNDSLDSGYTEITLENSHSEKTTGSVYQTIDSLPEDQAECSSGYGHLKMQTTKFIDKNYSHFPINQTNGNATRDTTYAHTGNATYEQVVNDNRDDNDNTYNKLETTSKTNTGIHIPEKQEEGSEDADAEYNHAKAGLPELTSENNADTYSHLNSTWQKTQAHSKHSFEMFAQNAKTELKEKQPTGPYESEIFFSGGKRLQNVGSDGYEMTALGPVHDYFVLEPENGSSGTEMSFHVVEDNAEEKDTDDECAKHHQYFTLEKTET